MRLAVPFALWSTVVIGVAYWLQRDVLPPAGPCNDLITPRMAPACAAPVSSGPLYAAVVAIWACGAIVGYLVLRRTRRARL